MTDLNPVDAMTTDYRTLLAQPVPEGPSDEDLLRVLDCATASFPPNHPKAEPMTAKEYALTLELHKARAVLARWGNSQAILDSSPQPVPVSERLPGPEDCDANALPTPENTND